jgi:uncharacterized protein YdhG (YjbR/CyaY superfamily)
MDTKKARYTTVDEYIAQAPKDVQPILKKIRATIKKAAPKAEEKISYQMPGYYLNGQLVWFGAHPHHIGFYPTGEGMQAFQKEFASYKTSKGAVQFPLDGPIPYALITRVVKYRIKEMAKKK